MCTIRVILCWEGKERRAHLYKSPSHPETVVSYQITVSSCHCVCLVAGLKINIFTVFIYRKME